MSDRDWESEAKKDGWSAKEEWRGDPEKWVDAKTFVENGEKITAIQKSKIERLESRIESQAQTLADFKKYHDDQLAKERRESEKRIAELQAERAKAISEGDGQTFTRAEKELDELRASVKEEPKKDGIEQVMNAWKSANPWYGKEDDMTIWADGISDRVISEGFSGQAYFNEITRRVKERFPENFGNPKRKEPSSVAEPGASRERSTGRSYDDLPPGDKATCDRFCREIKGFTKEQFLAQYDWDQE